MTDLDQGVWMSVGRKLLVILFKKNDLEDVNANDLYLECLLC